MMTDLTHEELVEMVARALKPRHGCDRYEGCEQAGIIGGCACRDDARATIATIREALKEPTEAMVTAADDQISFDAAGGYPSSAKAIWPIMLAASPLFKEGK